MRSNTIRRAWVDLLSKSKHVKISLTVGTIAQFICTVLCSAYYIASESNQVCLWLPYVLNTTKSRLFFPILLRTAWQWACDDWLMTSARQCTGTTFVLIVRSVCCRRWKANDVLLAFWLATQDWWTHRRKYYWVILYFATSKYSMTQLSSYWSSINNKNPTFQLAAVTQHVVHVVSRYF